MQEYSWWGFGENEPPEHLKTKKQLSQMGKRPGNPVGVIRTPKYDCYLYDPATCPAKRPLTEKQKTYRERRREVKKQAELENEKYAAEKSLESYLKLIHWNLEDICEAFQPDTFAALRAEHLGKEIYVKRRCDFIVKNCKRAKDELQFLRCDISSHPDPGSAVLGGKYSTCVPLDPDGECRAAVLGGISPP